MINNQPLRDYLKHDKFKPFTVDDFPLAQVLTSMHDGIVVVDRRGTIVYANPSYTRILGVPVQKVIGRPMQEVEPNARILRVLETGKPILQEPIYLPNLEIEVVADATPLLKNGEIIGGVTVFKKSGEVVRYYEALKRLKQVQQKHSELLSQPFNEIIGEDPNYFRILCLASSVSKTTASILLTGENGVGKEVIAKAIHEASDRINQPFIKINCAAIPEPLLESELFGYEDGAFTGAKKGGKPGKFELANGGTIFLDEIGDMSMSVQAKLLRVLHEREVERVGGSQTKKIDIRIISATNQNLERLIELKKFREDLYYRINVVPIQIPPLRNRWSDIPLLAEYYVSFFGEIYGKDVLLSDDVLTALTKYNWPGNVRQLKNFIEHAVVLCQEAIIRPEHLPYEIRELEEIEERKPVPADPEPAVSETFSEKEDDLAERMSIMKALHETNFNRSKAMEILGISRRTFYKKIKKYNIAFL